jgi:hypothetical protein
MPDSPATLEYALAAPAPEDVDVDRPAASVALYIAFGYVVACVAGLLVMGVVMALRV